MAQAGLQERFPYTGRTREQVRELYNPFFREHLKGSKPVLFLQKEVSSALSYRIDPVTREMCHISVDRAKRPMKTVPTTVEHVSKCDFCKPFGTTPEEKILHNGALTVQNPYPWTESQWVTIYPDFLKEGEQREVKHRLFPCELGFRDQQAMLESSFELASKFHREDGMGLFGDFTNWGVYAGGSIQHPHSQRARLDHLLQPGVRSIIMNELIQAAEYYWAHGENFYDRLIREELADGRRVVFDNKYLFIGATFAPEESNEFIYIAKGPFSSVLDMQRWEDRRAFIEPTLGIYPALYFYMGVENYNIVFHNAPFVPTWMDEELGLSPQQYFRFHGHVMSRKGSLPEKRAGAELGFGVRVVSSIPEKNAELAHAWYHDPTPGLIPPIEQRSNGKVVEVPDERRILQFHRHMNAEPMQDLYGCKP